MRAWRGEDLVALGPPQRRAVLAVLLLRVGRVVSADEIIEAVWGEDPPLTALGSVHTHVSMLRRVLDPARRSDDAPPPVLRSIGNGYSIPAPGPQSDLAAFDRLVAQARRTFEAAEVAASADLYRAALDLWSGDALADLPGPLAEAERTRLAEQRLCVTEERFDADLQCGRHTVVVSELAALAEAHPMRERLRVLHMRALHRCGRRAEALAVYADTRRVLIDQIGIEPGQELRELHRRLLSAEEDEEPRPARPARVGRAAVGDTAGHAPATVPAQLPADLPDFTGRTALVRRLTRTFEPRAHRSAPPVAAISGIGGVGKSSLAVHVAHLVREHYPDGQLYVDLHGTGEHGADPLAVLATMLRGLGVPPGAVPADLAERAALFRSVLADRQVLLVFDSASSTEQIRPLLPGSATCGLIITSRTQLIDLPGVEQFDLPKLSVEEAQTLFHRTVGPERTAAEPGPVKDIVAACGGLPLALRIAAARLVARPQWTVQTLADKLRDEQSRLDELRVGSLAVEACFHLGYRQLDPVTARAFRLLALPEGPSMPLTAAAAVLDLSVGEASDLVERLIDLNLLSCTVPDRFQMHDLLRLFGRARSQQHDPAEHRVAALRRFADSYLVTVGQSFRFLQPGGEVDASYDTSRAAGPAPANQDDAVAWLDGEMSTLMATARQFATDNLLPSAVVVDLITLLDPFLVRGTYFEQVGELGGLVAKAAGEAGDRRSEAWGRRKVGEAYLRRFELPEARAELRASLQAGRECGDTHSVARTLDLLGVVAWRQNRLDESLDHLTQAVTIYRELGDELGEAYVHSTIGRTRAERGDFDGAVEASERSRRIYRRLGNHVGLARALHLLAGVHLRFERFEEAVECLEESLVCCRAVGQKFGEGHNLAQLAKAYLACGQAQRALECAEQAREVSELIGDAHLNGLASAEAGRALRALGQFDRARQQLATASSLLQDLGSPQAAAVAALLRSV
ncbi:tetratricopeptide repeat protein [Solihabitans fulvus]|uniref:Tetratricopeptide repeat protein n=1 Tax=Solihabitans fulvus TaxID=1892852 RepID=A0A5B2WXW6_9PSEU|nr:AfsR/SARP family transcriptional regulator [Solihabitans fulvus]KAA2255239.1 tetratricopeptide repeat protein [Solihabitans fulvus]